MKNDTQIQQEILTEIKHDQNIPKDSIGVEVHHGVVKLAGCVSDAGVKTSAEHDARRVVGVTDVVMDMDATNI
jgi:osmotically-inducible protein OsmY